MEKTSTKILISLITIKLGAKVFAHCYKNVIAVLRECEVSVFEILSYSSL